VKSEWEWSTPKCTSKHSKFANPQFWSPICIEGMLKGFRILKQDMMSLSWNWASKPTNIAFANTWWNFNASSRFVPSLQQSILKPWYIFPWISNCSFLRWPPKGPHSRMIWYYVSSFKVEAFKFVDSTINIILICTIFERMMLPIVVTSINLFWNTLDKRTKECKISTRK